MWSGSRRSSGRKTVEQVGGGVEALSPEARGQRGLDQKGAHDVIRRANHPLSLAVLRRGIRTRHSQLNTPREEERTGGGVVELPPVVTLDGGARWWKTASRQKRQIKTARAKKKARVVQRKKEDEGCKGAPCCHTGAADILRPNPLQ